MSKQSQLRQLRKLRRNLGARRREHIAIVLIDKDGVTYVARSGKAIRYRYSGNPNLDFAEVELLKHQLVEHRFAEYDDGGFFIAPSTTLKTLYRLFPKTKFSVVPNN